jgi:hypothetical protein
LDNVRDREADDDDPRELVCDHPAELVPALLVPQ